MTAYHFNAIPHPLSTRSEVALACESLLTPLIPYFTPSHSTIHLGATATRFDARAADLEAYTRSLWGLASLLASPDLASTPSIQHLTSLYLDGLRNGTDPSHEGYWGDVRDTDQRMVEMCPLSYALLVAPQALWDPLTSTEKDNAGKWLAQVDQRAMPDTNWLWFRVFANLAMGKYGMPAFDGDRVERDLDRLDDYYRDDGWSNDGPQGYTQMDYYSGSFAIQFLSLLYVRVAPEGKRESRRKDVYKERARKYAADFVHYFDEEGRAITFGRSLTYKFAMAGFWTAVAFAGLDLGEMGLSWGVVKGLLLSNLRWWAGQRDVVREDGVLTIGYCYPNQFISENYNSPGSPYWFMLSFVALALGENHPFWKAKEESYPTEKVPKVLALEEPKHIMVKKGGHTFLLSSGQQCHYPMRAAESKYGKFAYSSAFGYSVPTGGYFVQAIGGDNMLSLSDDGGETWKVRKVATDAKIEEREGQPVLISGWQPWKDVEIETCLLPPTDEAPNWHLRLHHIVTARAIKTSEGAFALKGERRGDGLELQPFNVQQGEGRAGTDNAAIAVSESGAVGIISMGLRGTRQGQVIDEDSNSNLVHSRSVLPILAVDIPGGLDVWWVTAIFAVPSTASDWRQTWHNSWRERMPKVPQWVEEILKR